MKKVISILSLLIFLSCDQKNNSVNQQGNAKQSTIGLKTNQGNNMDYLFIAKGSKSLESILKKEFASAVSEMEELKATDTLSIVSESGFGMAMPVKDTEMVAEHFYAENKKVTYHFKNGIVLLLYNGKDDEFKNVTLKLAKLLDSKAYTEEEAEAKFSWEIHKRAE